VRRYGEPVLSRCITAAAASLLVMLPATAQAQAPFAPYDGSVPFQCELQNVGTGTDFGDPGADPFCVEFDKTNQNVTDFGIVDFTAQEPARVAAASSKCFYFQRDHWTGSVVQGGQPETWHWDGDYWFDRARGVGGASVKNFRIGGQPQDASPYVPQAYKPYFDEGGGGGVLVTMDTAPSPDCIGKVDTPQERDQVYADRAFYPGCIEPGGRLHGGRVGKVRLHMRRTRALKRLGPPTRADNKLDRWCLVGKGELRIGYQGRRVKAIVTSSRGHSIHGVSRGDRLRRARRRLKIDGADRRRSGARILFLHSPGPRSVWVGALKGRVRWVMIFRGTIDRRLALRLIRHVP
jgi:hypothetical protein